MLKQTLLENVGAEESRSNTGTGFEDTPVPGACFKPHTPSEQTRAEPETLNPNLESNPKLSITCHIYTHIYIYICKRNLYVLFDMAAFCIKSFNSFNSLNFLKSLRNY